MEGCVFDYIALCILDVDDIEFTLGVTFQLFLDGDADVKASQR